MSGVKVSIDGLQDAIMEELKRYNEEASEKLKQGLKKIADESVKELKATSPKLTGKYAKSWNAKKAYESDDDIRIVVNARSPEYRLTHLLEYGHAKVNGGRVAPKPHIKEVEDKVIEKAMKVVEEAYG